MKILQLTPLPSKRVQFQLSYLKFVPKNGGCYILTNFNTEILYIGKSKNIYKRFHQHLNSLEKTKVTKLGKVFWFYYLEYEIISIEKLERTWLNHFSNISGNLPELNKINASIS